MFFARMTNGDRDQLRDRVAASLMTPFWVGRNLKDDSPGIFWLLPFSLLFLESDEAGLVVEALML